MEADLPPLPFLPPSLFFVSFLPPESEPLLAHRNGDGEDAPQNKSFLAALTDPTREMTAGEKLLGSVALIVRPLLSFLSCFVEAFIVRFGEELLVLEAGIWDLKREEGKVLRSEKRSLV